VVWAEQYIPSGLAALLVATVPLFMVLLDWFWTRARRPDSGVLAGLALGLCGVLLLVGEPGSADGYMGLVAGVVVLLAALSWATGSVYSRHAVAPPTPRLATGMQMLTGGALLLGLSFVTGEPIGLRGLARPNMRRVVAGHVSVRAHH
jgi:drug/metabolite transporter (DMT)-like permease